MNNEEIISIQTSRYKRFRSRDVVGCYYWFLILFLCVVIRTSSIVFSFYEILNNGKKIQIRRRLHSSNSSSNNNTIEQQRSLSSSSSSSSNWFGFLTPGHHPELHFQDTHPEKFINNNNNNKSKTNNQDTNKVGKVVDGKEVVTDTPTDVPSHSPLPAYCGDGIVQEENGEECDDGTGYKTHAFQYRLQNAGIYSPCSDNCKWKNTVPIDCIHGITEALWIDIYVVTDSFQENWFELKRNSESVWNPTISGKFSTEFIPADSTLLLPEEQQQSSSTTATTKTGATTLVRSEYAQKDMTYHYSDCMSPDYCWEFDFLDVSTFYNNEIPVFDTQTNNVFNTATNYWAKLVVLTNGILNFSDEDYMSDGKMSGFKWGNCSR